MKSINPTFYLVCLFILFIFTGFAQEKVKIAVVSDIHFYSSSLAPTNEAKQNYQRQTGRNLSVLHEVLDTVISRISTQNPDFLFIAGDITHHGERQSHLDFVEKMRPLREKNIQILVIPGNHDVRIPNAKKYTDTETSPTASVSAKEFAEIYADFGYGTALKRDTASLSYLTQLNDNTYLLCFDTNRYAEHTKNSISSGRILPSTLQWALEILRKANKNNIKVLGMMHHGLVEHTPYQSTFFPAYLIADWQEKASILADAGMEIVFTGHFHANDATSFTTPSGNTITDVETGSLAQYPFPYRLMELTKNQLTINAFFVESIAGMPELASIYRQKLHANAISIAESRLNALGLPLPDETKNRLIELIAQMVVLHAKGDEIADEKTRKNIESLSVMLDNDDAELMLQLDFPPADNHLVIELKQR